MTSVGDARNSAAGSRSVNGLAVGVLSWKSGEEFGTTVSKALGEIGCSVQLSHLPAKLELPSMDVLLLYGPWGSIQPALRAWKATPVDARPRIVLWHSEQFPNPSTPQWIWSSLGWFRSHLDSWYSGLPEASRSGWRRPAGIVNGRLSRYRYYGDARRYFHNGSGNLLALWSDWTAKHLKRRGLAPHVAYMGHHEDFGRDLKLDRDVPVLWLGKPGSGRRRNLLTQIRNQLDAMGIELLVIDGEENPYVFGEARAQLLNRSKIVLNLLRRPWDNTSMRFFLSAPNGVLVVSEPMLPHIPFRAGDHYVEATPENMASEIKSYLDDEESRRAMAENARRLAVEDLQMRDSLASILTRVTGADNMMVQIASG